MSRLDGRVAIVTGGGRGIGAATAGRLAAEGAAVVVNDIDPVPAEETVTAIPRRWWAGGGVRGQHRRLCRGGAVGGVALEHFGALDILINNAGTTRDKMFHGMDDELFDFVLDANLKTAIHCARAAMPAMRETAKGGDRRVGTARTQPQDRLHLLGRRADGQPGAGQLRRRQGWTDRGHQDAGPRARPFGINVNAVAPGFVETRLTQAKQSGETYGIPEQMREMAKAMIALGRLGEPSDIAAVHAFLASSDSDFVSGVTIPVTGGQLGGM